MMIHLKRTVRLAALLGAGLVAGCGGSGGNSGMPVVSATPPAPAMVDAFYSLVVGQVSTTSEDQEPVAIEALAVTAPEDTEPVAM
jgi:hypothetical protein